MMSIKENTVRSTIMMGVAAAALTLGLSALATPASAAAAAAPAAGYMPPAKRISPINGLLATRTSTMPTPRRADGKVDFSGNWNGQFALTPYGPYGRRRVETFEADQATMQRANSWNKPLYKPEHWQKVRELDFSLVEIDPEYLCGAPGIPRIGMVNKITQTDNEIWLVYGGDEFRVIPIDGRERPADHSDEFSLSGASLGRWDGDTLLIETIGLGDENWFKWQGYFRGDQMKVTERFWRQGDLLFWNYTLEDPSILLQPWTTDTYTRRLNTNANFQLMPANECVPSDPKVLVDRYYRG